MKWSWKKTGFNCQTGTAVLWPLRIKIMDTDNTIFDYRIDLISSPAGATPTKPTLVFEAFDYQGSLEHVLKRATELIKFIRFGVPFSLNDWETKNAKYYPVKHDLGKVVNVRDVLINGVYISDTYLGYFAVTAVTNIDKIIRKTSSDLHLKIIDERFNAYSDTQGRAEELGKPMVSFKSIFDDAYYTVDLETFKEKFTPFKDKV